MPRPTVTYLASLNLYLFKGKTGVKTRGHTFQGVTVSRKRAAMCLLRAMTLKKYKVVLQHSITS